MVNKAWFTWVVAALIGGLFVFAIFWWTSSMRQQRQEQDVLAETVQSNDNPVLSLEVPQSEVSQSGENAQSGEPEPLWELSGGQQVIDDTEGELAFLGVAPTVSAKEGAAAISVAKDFSKATWDRKVDDSSQYDSIIRAYQQMGADTTKDEIARLQGLPVPEMKSWTQESGLIEVKPTHAVAVDGYTLDNYQVMVCGSPTYVNYPEVTVFADQMCDTITLTKQSGKWLVTSYEGYSQEWAENQD